jgi:cytosine/adenosine deaminase-related metal-dependent hydrolase
MGGGIGETGASFFGPSNGGMFGCGGRTEYIKVGCEDSTGTGQCPKAEPADAGGEGTIPFLDVVYDMLRIEDAGMPEAQAGEGLPPYTDASETPDLNDTGKLQDAGMELDAPAGEVFSKTEVIPGAGNSFLITGGIVVTADENGEIKIIPNGRVLFENDLLTCVGEVCPDSGNETQIKLLPTYKVYPGLIDSHNHPHYNAFPLFSHPGSNYKNDEDWSDSPEYEIWRDQYYNPNDKAGNDCQMTQYAIMRALVGGATAIQGITKNNKCLRSSKDQPWIIRQIDSFNGITPDKVKTSALGVSDEADAAKICEEQNSGKWERYIPHLSEGVQGDPTALKEFTNFQNWAGGCLLNEKLVAIHGNAFTQKEFNVFAPSGAMLVWSPSCHMDLYGEKKEASLDVPSALALGIPVALGPDWYASHGIGMMVELQKARYFSDTFFNSSVTAEQIFKMATVAGARVANLEDYIGKLLPGMKADITVVAGETADPYEPAYLGEVAAVFVDGLLYYGDQTIMAVQNVPNSNCEDLKVCGADKSICLPPTYADTSPTYSSIKESFFWVPDPVNKPEASQPFSAVPFDELPEACGK